MGPPSRSAAQLWRWLSQHPELFMPARRELGLHALPDLSGDLDWGQDPRLVDLVTSPEEYLRSFQPAGERKRGDGSTLYSLVPEAPRRIYKANPDAKLIFVLEAPVSRAFHAHAHNVTLGVEPQTNFDTALEIEPERIKAGASPFLCYATGSQYRQMIEPVDILFGQDNVLILIAEDAEREPRMTVRRIAQFLGVSPYDDLLPFVPRERQSVVSEMLARLRSRRKHPEISAQFRSAMVSEIQWMERRTGSSLDAWLKRDQE
jgi:hypothetical protein